MRPTWLIEAGVYRDEAVPLLEEIRRQGMVAEVLPHQLLRKGSAPIVGGQPLAPGGCVIGYGTFPFAQQILLHHHWVPGAWCSAANLDCAAYFAQFGRFLLNQHYAIMPGVEAIRQRDWLFSVFGRDERVFARPTSCHKLFVGRCIDRESFATALAPTRYDPATLVVIAAPQPIAREWRLVVIGDRVVSGSQYAVDGQRAIVADCPPEIHRFAESVLAEVLWRPDPAFMVDVCESAGRLWLVELNSFSGSWLYQCDMSAVVSAASELAERTWQQKHTEPVGSPDTDRDAH
jgi:ATP-grasp domain, R2K clade family 3